LMPSVFYMYPTQLGTGNTEIVVLGTYAGVDQEFKVNSTAQIEANKRYKLVFNAAELEFDLVIADYDEGPEMPVDPLEACTLSIIDATTGLGSFTAATNTYSLVPTGGGAPQYMTVTLNVPTKAGVSASAAKVGGATIMPDGSVSAIMSPPTLTYGIGWQQTAQFMITYIGWNKDTKTIVTFTDAADPSNTIELILKQEPLTYAFGDYYPDKYAMFSSPGVLASGTMPIGVVSYVDPSDPSHGRIMGLQYQNNLAWTTTGGVELHANDSLPGTGILNMATIQAVDSDFSDFPAFKYVHELNPPGQTYELTTKGVWYLPSSGEMDIIPLDNYGIPDRADELLPLFAFNAKGNMAAPSHPLFKVKSTADSFGLFSHVVFSNETGNTSGYYPPKDCSSSLYVLNGGYYVAFAAGPMTKTYSSIYEYVFPFMNF